MVVYSTIGGNDEHPTRRETVDVLDNVQNGISCCVGYYLSVNFQHT